MKIKIEIGGESLEEFEKITDAIICDLVNLRGMPTDDGQYMRYGIEHLGRGDLEVQIELAVHRVKCSRLDDY